VDDRFKEVAGHTVGVLGSFQPIYILWLHEWGQGLFQAAQVVDEEGEILAIIEEPADRRRSPEMWDLGEEERFQVVLREVLRGLDYGERKADKLWICLEGEWKELMA
jgi:hypothetical protein